jgi:hypothetical protein
MHISSCATKPNLTLRYYYYWYYLFIVCYFRAIRVRRSLHDATSMAHKQMQMAHKPTPPLSSLCTAGILQGPRLPMAPPPLTVPLSRARSTWAL